MDMFLINVVSIILAPMHRSICLDYKETQFGEPYAGINAAQSHGIELIVSAILSVEIIFKAVSTSPMKTDSLICNMY
jgi:hypothetical protein